MRAQLTLAESWRRVLVDDPAHARPIVSSLLKTRVTYTPGPAPKQWTCRGEGTRAGLFEKLICSVGGTSPTGSDHEWIAKFEGFRAA
jgi:hypothetical protein